MGVPFIGTCFAPSSSTGVRLVGSPHRTFVSFLLSVLFLGTAACGDFQDPASGVSPQATGQSVSRQPPEDRSGRAGNDSGPQAIPTEASLPSDSSPTPMTDRSVASSIDAGSTGYSSGPVPSDSSSATPPPSQTHPAATDGSGHVPPWLTPDGPQTKTVTLAWDPPATDSVGGYHVKITSMSTSVDYSFHAIREHSLTVTLPLPARYEVHVVAYNDAGTSPPALMTFDLF